MLSTEKGAATSCSHVNFVMQIDVVFDKFASSASPRFAEFETRMRKFLLELMEPTIHKVRLLTALLPVRAVPVPVFQYTGIPAYRYAGVPFDFQKLFFTFFTLSFLEDVFLLSQNMTVHFVSKF